MTSHAQARGRAHALAHTRAHAGTHAWAHAGIRAGAGTCAGAGAHATHVRTHAIYAPKRARTRTRTRALAANLPFLAANGSPNLPFCQHFPWPNRFSSAETAWHGPCAPLAVRRRPRRKRGQIRGREAKMNALLTDDRGNVYAVTGEGFEIMEYARRKGYSFLKYY